MLELMYEAQGVGLAANQVGLPYQLLVMNPTGDREQKEEEYVFINPVIQKRGGGMKEFEEGCLSFPDLHLTIARPDEITFQAIGPDGRPAVYHWKGFPARVVQHETDHLAGVLYVDLVSAVEKLKLADKLQKLAKKNGGAL